MRALTADTSNDFANVVKQVSMINGFAQFYVAEMSWAVDLGAHTSLAEPVLVHSAHEIVVDPVSYRVTAFPVCHFLVNLGHTEARHVFFRHDG